MDSSFEPARPALTLSLWQRRLLVAIVLLLTLAALAIGLKIGRNLAAFDQRYLVALETIRDAYEIRLGDLQSDVVDARLAYDVERQTLSTLRADLAVAHQDAVALKEEVTFYRSLMAPDKVAKGLQIAEFEASPLNDGSIAFHLLLTQIASRRSWVAGKVEIELAGVDGAAETEEVAVLPLTELAVATEYPLAYRFRYFQDLTGALRLPSGFEPEEIRVTVTPTKGKPIRRTFPWQAG